MAVPSSALSRLAFMYDGITLLGARMIEWMKEWILNRFDFAVRGIIRQTSL